MKNRPLDADLQPPHSAGAHLQCSAVPFRTRLGHIAGAWSRALPRPVGDGFAEDRVNSRQRLELLRQRIPKSAQICVAFSKMTGFRLQKQAGGPEAGDTA